MKPQGWAGYSEAERSTKTIDLSGNKDRIVEIWMIYFENGDVHDPKRQTKKSQTFKSWPSRCAGVEEKT